MWHPRRLPISRTGPECGHRVELPSITGKCGKTIIAIVQITSRNCLKKCVKYGQKTQYWNGDYKHCKTLPKRHAIPSWVAKSLQSHSSIIGLVGMVL